MGVGYHTFIIKQDNTLWSCGYNNYRQLGLNDAANRTAFTQVGTDKYKQVSCGGHHTFAIKEDGTLWSCGSNSNGQLGLGNTTQINTFTQIGNDKYKYVSCGGHHTFVIKEDMTLWRYKTNVTQIGTDKYKQVNCGYYHTFAIKQDNTLWSCGSNDNGQLGLNDTANRNVFIQNSHIAKYLWDNDFKLISLLIDNKNINYSIYNNLLFETNNIEESFSNSNLLLTNVNKIRQKNKIVKNRKIKKMEVK